MKSKGDYFYVKKYELKRNFTQIPNELFCITLTATEKLILAYLLSNSESFRITHYRIEKSVGSDHRTVKKALQKFRDMNLINQVSSKVISININEIIRLAKMVKVEDSINSDSPNSLNTTSMITNSYATSSDTVELQANNGNPADNIMVELPNNNIKQQEITKEEQKEVSNSNLSDVDKVKVYLKSNSKFLNNKYQLICYDLYQKYRMEYPGSHITNIQQFEFAVYYHLLKKTSSSAPNELKSSLIKLEPTLSLIDIVETLNEISTNQTISEDFMKKIRAALDKH